jgi:hypothetical protein
VLAVTTVTVASAVPVWGLLSQLPATPQSTGGTIAPAQLPSGRKSNLAVVPEKVQPRGEAPTSGCEVLEVHVTPLNKLMQGWPSAPKHSGPLHWPQVAAQQSSPDWIPLVQVVPCAGGKNICLPSLLN